MKSKSGLSMVLALGLWATIFYTRAVGAEDPRLDYAQQLLRQIPEDKQPALKIDATLGHPEAFTISNAESKSEILGGSPAGVLYGVQQWLLSPQATPSDSVEKPDFELRGSVLYLMKNSTYDFQLTPEEFPWFFDRPLLIKQLDYLFTNRFNTIFLWTGHLFPSIVAMPDYPDATDLPPEALQRNQEQFKWFTHECAKRNISVLLHSYQIHLPKSMGKARGIPIHYNKPNDFTTKYTRYALDRFLQEFDSVGLYVCPGEALNSKYTSQWIHDVYLAAAKASGKNPRIVVRDWWLDADDFKRLCVKEYDNLYIERKHNVEMVVSPVPDVRHEVWRNVAKKRIVNLHEVADLKPFRWSSPLYLQEMVAQWQKIGLDGAEIYGLVSWHWPYTLDKLEPQQSGYFPQGQKLLTMDRDSIWLDVFGRYLWKVDRSKDAEERHWKAKLAEKFGNDRAGELILQWYEVTGPVLPGLQNLTHVHNMNYFPTAVGKEQLIDAILDTEKCDKDYPAKPVDEFFFEYYKKKYNLPGLTDRITMPVALCAEKAAAGETISSVMTPDKVADLFVAMAEEGNRLAEEAQKTATKNQEELGRFVTDSQTLVLLAKFWRAKVFAAIAKRGFQKTGEEKYAEELLRHVRESITAYEQLVKITDATYLNATDQLLIFNWHDGLKAQQADAKAQETYLEKERGKKVPAK